jgi:hypothetical protein
MPAQIPTKSPATLPAKAADSTFDRFHPEMPRIPGVAGARPDSRAKLNGANAQRLIRILGAAAAVVAIVMAMVWWIRSARRKAVNAVSTGAALAQSPAPQPPPLAAVPPAHAGPAAAATVEELSKPWSAKKFIFVKPLTYENVEALVIRLPGGGLWAFALQEPYGRCELEFVTDAGQLAAKYGYRASHPMVVNPCNSTVYDPLKVGPLGGNTWARGEIVQGGGLRPPLSIDVVVRGHSIVADRME